MTGYLEDLERRRHHRTPRSSHWSRDESDTRPHPGPVSASCPLCRCERKIRYATWEDARAAGLAVSIENPRPTDANAPTPYPCDLIGEPHYHVGHLRFGGAA